MDIFITVKIPESYLVKFNEQQRRQIEAIAEIYSRYYYSSIESFIDKIDKTYLCFTVEDIENALEIYTSPELYGLDMSASFEEVLNLINRRGGVYLGIDDKGERRYFYGMNIPNRKHAAYIREKHGFRVVFFSYADWRYHKVNDNELPMRD